MRTSPEHEVSAGSAAVWAPGENHTTWADSPMTAVIVQRASLAAAGPGPLDAPDRLVSGNVALRAFIPEDVAAVTEAARDPYIQELVGRSPEDRNGAVAYVARQPTRQALGLGYSFAIADATTDMCVGQIGLWLRARATDGAAGYREEGHGRVALGYWVGPAHRRRGYATHALTAIAEWASTLPDVHRLELFVEPWNEGSWRAAEHAGFAPEGLLRSWQTIGNQRRDMLVYSRLVTERP